MTDSKKRSVVKSISWRILAVVLLATVAYSTTGDAQTVTMITAAYHGIQVLLFFLHERLWSRLDWGRTRGVFIQMTGLSGAGKTTLARLVAQNLKKKGIQVEVIDGDEYRAGLCSDLGFSKEDRNTNIRRLGFVAKVLARNNVVSIISAINPYDNVRKELEEKHGNVKTVFVDCGLETLKQRDTKGLYRKALLPDGHEEKIYNFTGVSDPFESPNNADLVINTEDTDISKSAGQLENFIIRSIS